MYLGLQFEGYEGNYDNFKLQEVVAILCKIYFVPYFGAGKSV